MNKDFYIPGYEPNNSIPGMTTYGAPAPSLTSNMPKWSLFGDTLKDGFQFGDSSQIGKNIWGGVQQGFNALGQNPQLQYVKDQLSQGITNNHTNVPDVNKFGNIMGGIQTAANLYGGYKQLKLANKQFEQQKDMWNKTWDDSKKNINENLEYRSQLRHNGNASRVNDDKKKYLV